VSYIQRHLALAFLPPLLVEQMIDETQPLGALSELVDGPVPLSWVGIPTRAASKIYLRIGFSIAFRTPRGFTPIVRKR
jgi:hypothetical protein